MPEKQAPTQRGPIQQWHAVARRTFIAVGIFSVFVNLLMLTMPIYLFQISDRVLTSRSLDTLLMLSLLALGFIVRAVAARHAAPPGAGPAGDAHGDDPRRPGAWPASSRTAPASDGGNVQPLRSLHQVRELHRPARPCCCCSTRRWRRSISRRSSSFIPTSASSSLAAGLLLIAIALLNQRATSAPARRRPALHASKADAQAEALARNSQVINAMGMLNESILHWGREQASALTMQSERARPQLLDQRRSRGSCG